MYEIAVSFTVQSDRRDDFIDIALRTGRDSLANEPGTQRFELLVDEADPNRFYLSEGYADEDAFKAHAGGPYFGAFFTEASSYADGPTWLIKGNRVEGNRRHDPATSAP